MTPRVLSEPIYEPRGVRYAFAPPQTVPGLGPGRTHVCTLTQADFTCPECERHNLTLVYYVSSHLVLVQYLWCVCGTSKPLAALRRLCGHDMTATSLRWRAGQIEESPAAGVSGVQFHDAGSQVFCWRCVLRADANDWQDDDSESHDFSALPETVGDWSRHCPNCRQSWRRGADDAVWCPMRYDLGESGGGDSWL